MALYLGNTKIAGSGAAADIPDTYKTYAETSAQLSNDGYATQGWVREQDFGSGISLSDVQATIFDFGNGDLSAFGWTGELSRQNLIDAGLVVNVPSPKFVKNPDAVRIGGGVTSIGRQAFWNCTGLSSMMIPDGVTSIEGQAFAACSGLTSVTIGDGVTSIGLGAFAGCSGLTSMTIPDSVISVEGFAFSNCTNLSEIKVEGKTQAEAEALLANAGVPDGCRIKTWARIIDPMYEPDYKILMAPGVDNMCMTSAFVPNQTGCGKYFYILGYSYNTVAAPDELRPLYGYDLSAEFENSKLFTVAIEYKKLVNTSPSYAIQIVCDGTPRGTIHPNHIKTAVINSTAGESRHFINLGVFKSKSNAPHYFGFITDNPANSFETTSGGDTLSFYIKYI